MSTVVQFAHGKSSISGYRFGRVELRVSSQRLWVDGRETALSPMAFKFLLELCRASGALLTRAEAFNLLWPGGGNGSDEALAQVVVKVRQALGAEAAALVTLRSRGFRIDLPVEPISFAHDSVIPEAPDAPPPPATAVTHGTSHSDPVTTTGKHAVAPGKHVSKIVGFLAAVIFAAFIAMLWPTRSNEMLDGYAMSPQQFGPISDQGARTLREILARDDEGDRPSAQHLLESLLESEPHSAAAPFFLLYLIGNDPQHENENRWRQAFNERLPATVPAYVQLLSRWVRIDDDEPGVELELLNAALKLEPSAWRLHLARAHVNLRLSHFDMALADLRAVPLSTLSPRYAMFVMSDRASLGDADAIQAELPALAKRSPLIADYVRARIEMARADWKAAQTAFEATAQRAEQEGLFGALSYAWLLGAVAAGEQGHWNDAIANAERALRTAKEHSAARRLFDGYALLGYARYRQDETAERATAPWDSANDEYQKSGNPPATARLWLLRTRLEPAWGAANAPPVAGATAQAVGLNALLAARRAWSSCATHEAKQALASADANGIDDGYFADEADLLRQDLGLPRHVAPTPPQVPYPMLERWITYWESARDAGGRGCVPTK
ncbi:MAG: winged helix-turn-helix domain-containing protein [Proteobacteria bacterium]|nr:winged helix-turn-helix domain-containing protein [Pseudomonadota bacterium]